MSTLPTIIEESKASSHNKQIFCATFDFNTFSLGTELLSIDELRYKKRHLLPNNTITKYAIQEYTNNANHTTITIINLSNHSLQKFQYAKIPTLNGRKPIYLHKLHTINNNYYLYISFSNKYKPKEYKNININNLTNELKRNNIKTVKILPLSFEGMALAIIYKQMPNTNSNIIDGILYHKHNTKVYTHFNREKTTDKREAINSRDYNYNEINTYKLNKKCIIKSLKHLSKIQKNAYKSTTHKRRKSSKSGENINMSLQRSHSRSISNSSISSISSVGSSSSSVFDQPLKVINEC